MYKISVIGLVKKIAILAILHSWSQYYTLTKKANSIWVKVFKNGPSKIF